MSRISGFSLAAALLASGLDADASAAELESVDVVRDGTVFRIELRSRLSVSPERAFAAFTRYQDLPRINPSVREVAVLSREGDLVRVRSELRVCLALYCPRMTMTQDMRGWGVDGTWALSATMVPEASDFRSGFGAWTFAPCTGGTCLVFRAELEPDFWVPRPLGNWLMRRVLREQAVTTSEGIERLAAERP